MLELVLALTLIVAAAAYLLFRRQPSQVAAPEHSRFQDSNRRGLFDNSPAQGAKVDVNQAATATRHALLARARAGDVEAIVEAHAAGDSDLYAEVLDALVARAEDRDAWEAIVLRIVEGPDLRSNARLANHEIEAFKTSPLVRAAARMLHVAALSGDAATYQRSVEALVEVWQGGALPDGSSEGLQELIASEYWVLSSAARRSGEGFVLKESLADWRRQLAASPGRVERKQSEQN